MGSEHSDDDSEAVATTPLSIRMAPKELTAIKAKTSGTTCPPMRFSALALSSRPCRPIETLCASRRRMLLKQKQHDGTLPELGPSSRSSPAHRIMKISDVSCGKWKSEKYLVAFIEAARSETGSIDLRLTRPRF